MERFLDAGDPELVPQDCTKLGVVHAGHPAPRIKVYSESCLHKDILCRDISLRKLKYQWPMTRVWIYNILLFSCLQTCSFLRVSQTRPYTLLAEKSCFATSFWFNMVRIPLTFWATNLLKNKKFNNHLKFNFKSHKIVCVCNTYKIIKTHTRQMWGNPHPHLECILPFS